MIPRLRLDLGPRDLANAWLACASPRSEGPARRRAELAFDPRGRAVGGQSVRTLLDALLTELAFPPGSEVVMSPLTMTDMIRVVEAHGLVPVPADLDPGTAFPTPEGLRAACTPRTRALLVAHLFGGRCDLEPALALAREHGLVVLEDAAQALDAGGWRGTSGADATLFSFGMIKTGTALGGALGIVGDDDLRGRLRARVATLPLRPRSWFLRRTVRATLLAVLGLRPCYTLLAKVRPDLDRVIGGAARGFPAGELLEELRTRPPASLWDFLCTRLRHPDKARLERRTSLGRGLGPCFGPGRHLGGAQPLHTHWVVPVLSDDPDRLVERLRARGIDATRSSSLEAVAHHAPTEKLLAEVVFVPHQAPHVAVRRALEET